MRRRSSAGAVKDPFVHLRVVDVECEDRQGHIGDIAT
jgi:hypothetical protein